MSKKDLKAIHGYLSHTVRPTWHTPPPSNLGEANHGKLKADQWRSAIEFDIPAAIAQVWQRNLQDAESEQSQRRKKLIDATFLLATAIRWTTSYVTGPMHAMQYMPCMVAYLNILKDLYPNLPWRPNHHAALHIGHFLLLFGPMHGWWMFPFERLIGRLQKISINYKRGTYSSLSSANTTDGQPGELERTMLETMCASINFKTLLLQYNDMPVLQKLGLVIDRAMKDRSRDPLAGVMSFHKELPLSSVLTARQSKPSPLSTSALQAFYAYYQGSLRRSLPILSPTSTSTHSINGLTFSVLTESERNSTIFFRSEGGEQIPAVIHFIVSIPVDNQPEVFYIVKQYTPLQHPVPHDPFALHPAFGGSLWASRMDSALTVISSRRVVCHGIKRRWVNGITLLKPLDRVRSFISSLPYPTDEFCLRHSLSIQKIHNKGMSPPAPNAIIHSTSAAKTSIIKF